MNKYNLEFRQIRESQRLTQNEFAQKLGISVSIIAKIESGQTHISNKIAEKVVNTYPELTIKLKDFTDQKSVLSNTGFINNVKHFLAPKTPNSYVWKGKTYETDEELLEFSILITNEISSTIDKTLKIIHFSHLADCPIFLSEEDVDLFNTLKSKDFLNKAVLDMSKENRNLFYSELIENSFLKNTISKNLLSKYFDMFYNSICLKNKDATVILDPKLFMKKE